MHYVVLTKIQCRAKAVRSLKEIDLEVPSLGESGLARSSQGQISCTHRVLQNRLGAGAPHGNETQWQQRDVRLYGSLPAWHLEVTLALSYSKTWTK